MILKEMWQRIVYRRLEKKFSSQKVPLRIMWCAPEHEKLRKSP